MQRSTKVQERSKFLKWRNIKTKIINTRNVNLEMLHGKQFLVHYLPNNSTLNDTNYTFVLSIDQLNTFIFHIQFC